MMRKLYFVLILLFILKSGLCNSNLKINSVDSIFYANKHLYFFEDPLGSEKIESLINNPDKFRTTNSSVNFGLSDSYFWLKFRITNQTELKSLVLNCEYPLIDSITFFIVNENKIEACYTMGDAYVFNKRIFRHNDFIFPIKINKDEEREIYLRVQTKKHLLIPVYITSLKHLHKVLFQKDLLLGAFFGILATMLLYNLFLYGTVKDKNYLYYVLYILFVTLSQLSIHGVGFKYIWYAYPTLNVYALIVFASLAGIFAIIFFYQFLQIGNNFKKSKFLFIAFGLLYIIAIFFSCINKQNISLLLIDINTILISLLVIIVSVIMIIKGNRSSIYILAGWSFALTGFTLFALRNLGALPFNNLTNYSMPIGITMEAIIFSLALANRINTLRKENEEKQQEIIKYLKASEEFTKITQELELNAEKLKKEMISTEFEALKNQVNPHFLFNSLSVLTELVYQNRDQAADFIKKLSEVYRYVLDNKNKEVVSLKTEIDFIESFSFLLRIRFDKNLSISIKIKYTEEIFIPPLTLQLLIENAIKHNIISEERPLHIDIIEEDEWIIVKNNLQTKKANSHSTGVGLENIKNRYKIISDKNIIIDTPVDYYIVKIPKLYALK